MRGTNGALDAGRADGGRTASPDGRTLGTGRREGGGVEPGRRDGAPSGCGDRDADGPEHVTPKAPVSRQSVRPRSFDLSRSGSRSNGDPLCPGEANGRPWPGKAPRCPGNADVNGTPCPGNELVNGTP